MDLYSRDGIIGPLTEGALPFSDLLIQRGIGVFEAFITPGGRPLAYEAHIARLHRSATLLHLPLPVSDSELAKMTWEGIAAHGGEPLVRIYLTGGDRSDATGFPNPRLFMLFLDYTPHPETYYQDGGMVMYTLKTERFWPLAKTINYSVPYVQQLGRDAHSEVLYTPEGLITEGHSSSFFLIKGKELITAPLSRVLTGTTRGIALTLAREAGYTVTERCPAVSELAEADEAFVASSSKLFMPVTAVDDRPIGTGRAGEVTKNLLERYRSQLSRFTTDLQKLF